MLGPQDLLHSLEQIAFILKLSQQDALRPREAMFLAAQLVDHGFPNSESFLTRLENDIPSHAAHEYLARLKQRNSVIQSLPHLDRFRRDPVLVRRFYESEGWLFRPGSFRRNIAIVVFTTIYNNFTLSNLVLDALLADLGVSRLYVRDTTEFVYFRGVKGLASSLQALPGALQRLLEGEGIEHVIITGYSSGGYASLFVTSLMTKVRYLGFSICSDLSAGSELTRREMYERLRHRVDSALFRDMRPEIAQTNGTSYCVHYGQRSADDRTQAEHLRGLGNVELFCHESAGHEITAFLLEEGQLSECFARQVRAVELE